MKNIEILAKLNCHYMTFDPMKEFEIRITGDYGRGLEYGFLCLCCDGNTDKYYSEKEWKEIIEEIRTKKIVKHRETIRNIELYIGHEGKRKNQDPFKSYLDLFLEEWDKINKFLMSETNVKTLEKKSKK